MRTSRSIKLINMRRSFSLISFVLFCGLVVFFFIVSCQEEGSAPIIGQPKVSKTYIHGATVEARILYDGDSEITSCGFCWNKTGYASSDFTCAEAELIDDRILINLDTLKEGTRYYVWPFARNEISVTYGSSAYFVTTTVKIPQIATYGAFKVTHNAVMINACLYEDNGFNTFEKGVCWSTGPNPTLEDTKTSVDLNGFGSFMVAATGLDPSTVYYFRAFATNAAGTAYGSIVSYRTLDGSVTDRDGFVYSTVRLGNQEWMASNLRSTYFSNGESIPKTGTETKNIEGEVNPVYQWPYQGHEDHPELLEDDGRLYTWYAVTDNRKLCPDGWHIPSLDEWNELLYQIGGDKPYSPDLRSFSYRPDPLNPELTEAGFRAHLAGFRNASGLFQSGHNYGTYWWSSTSISDENAYSVFCSPSDNDPVNIREKSKKNGYSVRCVKD